MMAYMTFPVDRIGNPQGQRQTADRCIDASRWGRMSVNGLVLQRAIPADQDASEWRGKPQGQRSKIQAPERKATEGDDCDADSA